LINGESDRWPGLVLDRYAGTLVLKLYTAAWLPRFDEICSLLHTKLQPESLVLRLSKNVERLATGRRDGEFIVGSPGSGEGGSPVVFLESGLKFEADVVRGQKTGFFLDQRENRRKVETFARGRTMLNAFSFSGGFSLYAARGGAVSVTDLDISAHALAGAGRNFGLNAGQRAVTACRQERVRADVFDWLEVNQRRRFDLIVVDPPSFARRESERAGAIAAYEKLAAGAIRHLSPGGILVACSCSAHVNAEEFFQAVRSSARRLKRKFEEMETTRHPADHPATFPEAEYLKAIYLRL
jgi:23S rRNA (cytosine1962-C5)-methyltransferase